MTIIPYYLLLGSNLGNRVETLEKAIELIRERVGKIISQSAFYETEPWGYADQPWFINQAVKVQSELAPVDLLKVIKEIEKDCGREENEKWHARHLDIDILLWGSKTLELPELRIPHPYLGERNFALLPLLDIGPDEMHPNFGMTIEELYQVSKDPGEVYIFEPNGEDQSI